MSRLSSLASEPSLAESQRIEFKRQLTEGFEKEVVAFLNANDGGLIYIGINDQGKAVALENIDQLQLKIKDRLKHNISPSTMGLFDVLIEPYQGLPIIKVVVARGSEQPYFLKKQACRLRAVLFALDRRQSLCHSV